MNLAKRSVTVVYGSIRVQMELAGAALTCVRINRDFTRATVALEFAAALTMDATVMQAELDQWLE